MNKLTPKESVRAYCTQCLGMSQHNVELIRDCQGDHVKCAFFPYRLGKRAPLRAFRKYCITDCMNGYKESVRDCTTENCPNHPYRMGTNPALQGQVRGASLIQKRAKKGVGEAFCDLKPAFSLQRV